MANKTQKGRSSSADRNRYNVIHVGRAWHEREHLDSLYRDAKKRVLKKPNDNLWEGISGASKIYCAGEVRKKYGILFLKNVGNFFTYGPSKRI